VQALDGLAGVGCWVECWQHATPWSVGGRTRRDHCARAMPTHFWRMLFRHHRDSRPAAHAVLQRAWGDLAANSALAGDRNRHPVAATAVRDLPIAL